jgi:hypothetical protein
MDQRHVDAWMFLGVAFGRGPNRGARLKDIVAAADWVNRAIPLEEELTGGLNRLIAGGYVRSSRGTFALTHSGEALHQKVKKRAGIWTQLDRLATAFESLETPPSPFWKPTPETVRAGIDGWLREADDIRKADDPRRRRQPPET